MGLLRALLLRWIGCRSGSCAFRFEGVLPRAAVAFESLANGRGASCCRGLDGGFPGAVACAGARSDGEPGPRAEYGESYYGCFVRDLDGHKIEATYYRLTEES